MARQDDIGKLIHNYTRRLQTLKEKKALAGWSVDPGILLEIEEIEAEIKDLQVEMEIIENRLKTAPAGGGLVGETYEQAPQMADSPRLLVADDEPDFLRHLCLTLEVAGYQTIAARDGHEALIKLQLQPVDLILADIAMPHMSGYQLYERVYENPNWITIPFIFISARAMDSDIYYGKELGVDDYLIKPIQVGNLLAVIRGKLRRRMAIAQHLKRVAALT